MSIETLAEPKRSGEKLSGRVAFVTGGTRGIGAAICHSLAAQGATVAAGYHSGAERAAELCRRLEAYGVAASAHQGNIGSSEDCGRTVGEVIERHGRLDILINNAGITSDKTVLNLTDHDWHTVIDVNLSGAFFTSRAVLPHMLERGSGRIVNISSMVGETGNIGQVNYSSSKAGLFGLTKSLALEAAHALKRAGKQNDIGITVNTVTPGYTATEMIRSIPEKTMERAKAQIPLGRFCQPEEVARVVHFLAADASGYITGQVWGVNGGMDM
ncbi:MAG TPA: 3-oxoacyl-ACP reductase family protein [Solirubrobacteraceae bacterium]|nr:3-oxoacyl-ACP reductase family protein [Solirubrobacteraceae bacterium]